MNEGQSLLILSKQQTITDEASLSDDARQIIQGTNAGGNSEISEAISYEIFYRYGAELVMVSKVFLLLLRLADGLTEDIGR